MLKCTILKKVQKFSPQTGLVKMFGDPARVFPRAPLWFSTGLVNRTTVVIPYVHGLSETVTRAYRRHGISSAMKPFQTIRSLLVHPKDKRRHHDACECVCVKYHVKTVTKRTLEKQAELSEYVFRNTDRKSHNVM